MKKEKIKDEEINKPIEKNQHEENNETQNQSKEKKKRTINGISIWRR